jgi:hypothetical protein
MKIIIGTTIDITLIAMLIAIVMWYRILERRHGRTRTDRAFFSDHPPPDALTVTIFPAGRGVCDVTGGCVR